MAIFKKEAGVNTPVEYTLGKQNVIPLTYAQYMSLTEAERNNGTIYHIKDRSAVAPTAEDSSYDNTQSGLTATNVQGAVDELSSDLAEYANVYGSKNLLNPSWDTHASTYGFSYTKNDNGQLVMSGSNTDSSLHGLEVKSSADGLVLEDGKKYIFSGGSEDPSKTYLQINYVSGGSSHIIANLNTSDSVEITGNGYPISVYVIVRPGANVDGMIFEPMIRMASISDSTFVPYVPTNKQLFSDLSELQTYSTTEQLTGKKWIDGKPIYRKTYYLAQSTSAGSGSLFVYTIGDSPTNMKTLVSISGQAMSGTYWVSLPNAAYDAVQYNIQVAVGRGGKVELFGGVSNILYDVTLILEYTKTTD